MSVTLKRLVREVESGRVSRREVVATLAALLAATRAAGAQHPAAGPTFTATGLNHVALRVTDVGRSRDFYVEHLGLSVARESPGSSFLTCGDHFVALFQGERAGLDHYCYSVEGYDVARAAERLRAVGIEPRVRGDRIYFDDPDGVEVQLAAGGHRP